MTNNKIEVYFNPQTITHEQKDDSAGMLSGFVTKFGQVSADRGGYKDRFAPTAFQNLQSDTYSVKALLDHSNTYLGRTDNGTLKLYQDDQGLRFSLDLPPTQDGRDVATLVARKDLTGMSFGYVPNEYTWNDDRANPIRTHTGGELVEVSVVFDPAFKATSVALHSLSEPDPEVLEELKRLHGTPMLNAAKRTLQLAKTKLVP